MPRHPIICIYPDGSNFLATVAEAKEIVRDDLGAWDGKKRISMKRQGGSGGQLSLRVGAPLASAVFRGESWAVVAVSGMRR